MNINDCCFAMLRHCNWRGRRGDVLVCPNCRRMWSWEDGAWWPGPVQPEKKEEPCP